MIISKEIFKNIYLISVPIGILITIKAYISDKYKDGFMEKVQYLIYSLIIIMGVFTINLFIYVWYLFFMGVISK